MFTGLVETCGSLGRLSPRGSGARLTIHTTLGHAEPFVSGESISVDGVCLTVVAFAPGAFEADASAETLARTTLGSLAPGALVNLERATKLGGRMGGHIVTGHVDGVGTLVEREPDSGSVKLTFRVPTGLARFIAEKGSIAVSGVSLTVNWASSDRFGVTIIPHTLESTSLRALALQSAVNLEVDIVARYVARLHAFDQGLAGAAEKADGAASADDALLASLTKAGYV